MTDFLFLLARINLAMAAAVVAVCLLRRPMRTAFHANIAYGLWLLVPMMMLASLLPARTIAFAAQPVRMPIAPALRALPEQAAERLVQAAPMDWSLLLLMVWLGGVAAMALAMARQQRQFHEAEKLGAAGPAVTGFLRPRIVLPDWFEVQFSAAEQDAILAHEAAHLARQDARINAIVAFLRCLCWFNPFAHLGAVWLRKDQELACDARAVRQVARRDYARALLKSQMHAMVLPLGCSWPGREHPLTERVALLTHAQPTAARRRAGLALVTLVGLCGAAGAWAVQPSAHKGFVGKIFYSEQANGNGPAYMLSLESGQEDKFVIGDDKNPVAHDRVLLRFPIGFAQADDARNDFQMDQDMTTHKTIILTGNVKMSTGLDFPAMKRGRTLVFDARTGMLDLDGKVFPSGMPKYVPCTRNCKRL
jgi:beta-lactamase regulating signal transducer with metallopeptidase domain